MNIYLKSALVFIVGVLVMTALWELFGTMINSIIWSFGGSAVATYFMYKKFQDDSKG